MGATEMETTTPPTEETLPDPGGDRAAVGAAEIDAVLSAPPDAADDWGATEEASIWDSPPPPDETESAKTPVSKPANDGPTPAEVAFKASINTVLTLWEVTILKEAAPPEQIKDLVAQAWTDCARAMGWLEHANDPRIAVLLATGLTAGTYGVATYTVIEEKRKKKAREK